MTQTPWKVLSLGAGVQSSTLALMYSTGYLPDAPSHAIFADTQAEPASVYRWLDWLEGQLTFPVVRVTKGNITEAALTLRHHQKKPGVTWSKSVVPAFIKNPDGSQGKFRRICTADYKISQLRKAVRRLCCIKRGQTECTVTQIIGISYDEIQRVRISTDPWAQFSYPLIDLKIRRHDCLAWMRDHGYPQPPRSACVWCPFHSDEEWRRLRDHEPEEFARAVKFDHDFRALKAQTNNMTGVPYLHRSMVPLDEVSFDGQGELPFDGFNNECEGMCGV